MEYLLPYIPPHYNTQFEYFLSKCAFGIYPSFAIHCSYFLGVNYAVDIGNESLALNILFKCC